MKFVLSVICGAALLCASCQESFDERCVRESREFTQKYCPKSVDDGIVLDSATYDAAARTYSYWYALSGRLDKDDVREELRRRSGELKERVLRSLRNSIELKPYKDEGISFSYVYVSDSLGKPFLRFTFTAKDYGAR